MDFNIEKIRELMDLDNTLSDEAITDILNKSITIQAVVGNEDDGDEDVFPLIKLPAWTLVEAYQDIVSVEKGERTEEEAREGFKKRIEELIDTEVIKNLITNCN